MEKRWVWLGAWAEAGLMESARHGRDSQSGGNRGWKDAKGGCERPGARLGRSCSGRQVGG